MGQSSITIACPMCGVFVKGGNSYVARHKERLHGVTRMPGQKGRPVGSVDTKPRAAKTKRVEAPRDPSEKEYASFQEFKAICQQLQTESLEKKKAKNIQLRLASDIIQVHCTDDCSRCDRRKE